jgi:hypothetical protein
MGYFTPETYESFLARDEEQARFEARRQARRDMDCYPGEGTHCRDEHDYDEANWMPVVVSEAGLSDDEAAAFVAIVERKPVVVERMQMELFPEVA